MSDLCDCVIPEPYKSRNNEDGYAFYCWTCELRVPRDLVTLKDREEQAGFDISHKTYTTEKKENRIVNYFFPWHDRPAVYFDD